MDLAAFLTIPANMTNELKYTLVTFMCHLSNAYFIYLTVSMFALVLTNFTVSKNENKTVTTRISCIFILAKK